MSVLRSRRARAVTAAAALLALLAPSAAHAITNGKPTTAYGNVGSFVVEVEPAGGEPYLVQLCTGTMVSGADRFDRLVAEGRSWPRETAVARVLDLLG